jgi:putative spermidine/putrescine transport system substrate-binding protein/spermidine/putrescine transport system substrate-binding protein
LTKTGCTGKFFVEQFDDSTGVAGPVSVWNTERCLGIAAKGCLTQEQYMERHQDDPTYLDSLVPYQELARREAHVERWNAMKAAP